MANVRINMWETLPVFSDPSLQRMIANNSINIQYGYLEGSLSLSQAAVIVSQGGSNAGRTLNMSLGIYTLNGSTLSLLNSGSFQITNTAGGGSYRTFAMSAVIDMPPGDYYFALKSSTAGVSLYSLYTPGNQSINSLGYNGPLFDGFRSASVTGMPASIATSDVAKMTGTSSGKYQPYILLTA